MRNGEVVGGNGDSVVSGGKQQQKQMVVQGGSSGGGARLGGGNNNGLIPSSFRTLSGCLRVVSSGASNVVRSAASAASAMVERRESESSCDQVYWAGFDKLDRAEGTSKRVLLLGYRYGFQVFDVEEIHNVHTLVSRYDGPVSFMQILPKPVPSKQSTDPFAESRPLLMICTDVSFLGGGNLGGSANSHNGSLQQSSVSANPCFIPTVVWFYSLKSQTYVHLLKFRSVVHLVRCSSRVVVVLQGSQIHCFDTATLEREYTILTNPVMDFPGSGGLGVGPLAVGPRWMAYSGSPVVDTNPARVSSQHLSPSASSSTPSFNGSLVAHYAKESSKHLAAGIVTLGDMGIKKISRYYSELLPDNNNPQSGSTSVRVQGIANGHSVDADSVGMVIIRDTVSKTVITQFRAHKSPISSLCFNPSGTLLVTASVQGHNINVFRILPVLSSGSAGADPGSSYVHLYRLQRGFTNAVIQDISFSNDSRWILVSSSRGTSHLFDLSPFGDPLSSIYADTCTNERSQESSVMSKHVLRRHLNLGPQVLYQQNACAPAPPVTLSAVNRIRSGSNRWRNSFSSATVVASGKTNSASGAIASAFYGCNDIQVHGTSSSLKTDYDLLVFSPSGCLIQYAVRGYLEPDSVSTFSGVEAVHEPGSDSESRLSVEAIQKWNICQKPNLKEAGDNFDIYGQNGYSRSSKVFPERTKQENDACSGSSSTMTRHKLTPEEKHHLFMSEVELQTHEARTPLWAKPEIYFQSMVWDGFGIKSDAGEVEIEKMPAHNIEVRSKDLVPAYGYLQTPMFQKGRSYGNEFILGPKSEKISSQAGVESVDSMTTADVHKGTGETGFPGLQMWTEKVEGSVYTGTSDSPIANT